MLHMDTSLIPILKPFKLSVGNYCFIKDCQLLPHQIGYNRQSTAFENLSSEDTY